MMRNGRIKGKLVVNWELKGLTRRLKATNSGGVRVSDLPITGMTFTRGESLLMSSISSSRKLTQLKSVSAWLSYVLSL